MNLGDFKTITEAVQYVTITAGILIGGFWAYYRYIKGRLFALRINVDLTHQIINAGKSHVLVALARIPPKDVLGDSP